jgi:hypothetical protein
MFLDSGVLVDGCFSQWSASKAVLILAAQTAHFTIVLAEVVDSEVRTALMRRGASLPPQGAQRLLAAYQLWCARVQLERWPVPTPEAVARYRSSILPAMRHIKDLAPAISAIEAAPNWVLSTVTSVPATIVLVSSGRSRLDRPR